MRERLSPVLSAPVSPPVAAESASAQAARLRVVAAKLAAVDKRGMMPSCWRRPAAAWAPPASTQSSLANQPCAQTRLSRSASEQSACRPCAARRPTCGTAAQLPRHGSPPSSWPRLVLAPAGVVRARFEPGCAVPPRARLLLLSCAVWCLIDLAVEGDAGVEQDVRGRTQTVSVHCCICLLLPAAQKMQRPPQRLFPGLA